MVDVMEIWHLQDQVLILKYLAIMVHTVHFEPKAKLIKNDIVTCHKYYDWNNVVHISYVIVHTGNLEDVYILAAA